MERRDTRFTRVRSACCALQMAKTLRLHRCFNKICAFRFATLFLTVTLITALLSGGIQVVSFEHKFSPCTSETPFLASMS